MTDYYQIPSSMTAPVESILNRRIRDLKSKYPELVQKRRMSRARFMLAGAMSLLAQDDKVVLDMFDLASMNMELCRKTKEEAGA